MYPLFDRIAMNQPEVINYNELEAALQEREQWQGIWPAVRVIDFLNGKISKYTTVNVHDAVEVNWFSD